MQYNECVILNNPHYPETEIKIPWKDFIGSITDMSYSTNNNKIISNLNNLLPDYYNEAKEEFDKVFNKFLQ